MARALIALIVFLIASVAVPAAANPLLGGRPAAEPPVERVERPEPAEPTLLARLGTRLLQVQRQVNAEIARHMSAIRSGESSVALFVGLGFAFLYGVVHAVGPGHGKLVIASYFLAREARVWRGMLMGAQIAVCHVISAVIIVTLADFLLRRTLGAPPGEVPGVRLASYAIIFAIGSIMLVQAWRRSGRGHHDHGGHHGCAACRADGRQQGLLALGVGVVPCTGSVLIMLYAMANGMLTTGFAMVAMIAVGMALTMAALGVLAIVARGFVAARVASGSGRARVGLVLDVGGACAITALGAGLLVTAL